MNSDSPQVDTGQSSWPTAQVTDAPRDDGFNTSNASCSCNSSNTSLQHDAEWRFVHPVTYAVPLTAAIIITIFGNTLVVLSVLKFRKLRKQVCFRFMASLAVADIMVAALVMTMSVAYIIAEEWSFGWILCRFWISCDVMCCTASILHLCLISLDRYIAITKPLIYETIMTNRRAAYMMAGTWFCSALISFLPIYLGWFTTADNAHKTVDETLICTLTVNQPYAVVSSCTSFYIPFIVMVLLYARIFKIAMKQVKEIKKLETLMPKTFTRSSSKNSDGSIMLADGGRIKKKHSSRSAGDSKAIKTLGLIMGLFSLCWLPFFLMYLILPFCPSCTISDFWVNFITWIGYGNSMLNPVLYAFMNRDFKLAFKALLCCHPFRSEASYAYHDYNDINRISLQSQQSAQQNQRCSRSFSVRCNNNGNAS